MSNHTPGPWNDIRRTETGFPPREAWLSSLDEYIDIHGAMFPVDNGDTREELFFSLTWDRPSRRGYITFETRDGNGPTPNGTYMDLRQGFSEAQFLQFAQSLLPASDFRLVHDAIKEDNKT